MFCEECGTKNEKDATFCEKCGHKLTDEEVAKVARPKEPMSKKNKTILASVCAVVIALIGIYMYLGSLVKPEKVALKYFKAYAANDADALYSTLNLEESKFVSKSLLKSGLKGKKKINLANYSVEKNSNSSDDLSTKITIRYVTDKSSKEKTKVIKLTKNKNKKWLFFDNWTVDSSELIANDYTVTVPTGSTLKINNIEVGKKYKKDSYLSYYDKYEIPEILIGNYKITVILKSGIVLSGDMDVTPYGSFNSSKLSIDSKNEKKLKKEIEESIKLLYESAINDKSFDDIKDKFDEDYRDDIEYRYDSIKSGAQSSYNKLKEFKLKNVEIKSTSFDEDEMRLSVDIKYDYKVEYGYDDDKKEYSKKDVSDKYISVKYVYKNKKFIMTNITGLPTYFSHYNY